MSKRRAKLVALILSVVVLLGIPGLVGCGGGEAVELPVIKIGVLTDFTGPASFAVKPMVNGVMEYLKLAVEDGTIQGADVKIITYDQRTDYARTPPGYIWLKGQGVVMMNILSPTDRLMLKDKFEPDRMPVFGSTLDEDAPANPWIFCYGLSNGMELEVLLQWVMNTWDYAGKGRPPKIGHNSWNIASATFHQVGIDRMLQLYPDKFNFAGLSKAPMGQSSWAGEVAKFKDCDYIYISTSGAMTTTFIKESRDRGYTGVFLGCQDSFPGYFDLVEAALPADKIGECYMEVPTCWWNEDNAFIRGAKEAVQRFHPGEAAAMMRNSGPTAGWLTGMLIADAIKRAIATVGAENVDGPALQQAFLATNLTVDGFPFPLKYTDKNHAAVNAMKVYKFDGALPNKWKAVSGDWIEAISFK